MKSQSAIFLVESDTAMCDAFAALAQAYGRGFFLYASLDLAIKEAVPGHDDVVIADIHRAEDVRRFVVWLGNLPALPRAVILTSLAPEMVRRVIGPGTTIAVLRKPVDMNELSTFITRQSEGDE